MEREREVCEAEYKEAIKTSFALNYAAAIHAIQCGKTKFQQNRQPSWGTFEIEFWIAPATTFH